jgi:hypothetical protein
MSVLLDNCTATVLYDRDKEDEHGYMGTTDTPVLVWSGTCNVQESAPLPAPELGAPGGKGPLDPVLLYSVEAYLPPGTPVEPGMLLRWSGREYRITTVTYNRDPEPSAGAVDISTTQIVATLTSGGVHGEAVPAQLLQSHAPH